jgi:ankyrin repeat protein
MRQFACLVLIACLSSVSSPSLGQAPPYHPSRSEVAQADLLFSLATNNRKGVEAALKAGANPNESDFIEEAPLFFAKDVASVKTLLHYGAEVNNVTRKGSALTSALLAGNDPVAQFLLARGATPLSVRGDKLTPLMAAALNGTIPSLRRLIDMKAGVNAATREGTTPLMFAVRGKQPEAVKLLLKAGAKPDACDSLKRTALHYAAMRGDSGLVRLLCTFGASPGAKDFNGDTPLHLAAKYSGDVATIHELQQSGAKGGVKDRFGFRPAGLAARYGSSAVAACFGATPETPRLVRRRAVDQAIQPAVARIQASMTTFIQKAGCVSCHHHGLGVMALTQAAQHRFSVDKGVLGEYFKEIGEDGKADAAVTHAAAQDAQYVKMLPPVHLGDEVYGGAYILGGLCSAGVPSNPGFGEGVTVMARLQLPDGRFNSIRRGIMEHSDLMTTALTFGVLNAYWPADKKDELKAVAAKAKHWALSTEPLCAEDLAGRLLLLSEAGGSAQEIQAATVRLRQAQRSDGGWGCRERQVSDSYTTGVSLYALRKGAGVARTDPQLKRAAAFLIRTQEDDGSWYEPKLTPAYNNHFDASFPHGYDQFASFAGTCWATLGLLTMTP